jgi:hypothetical protein
METSNLAHDAPGHVIFCIRYSFTSLGPIHSLHHERQQVWSAGSKSPWTMKKSKFKTRGNCKYQKLELFLKLLFFSPEYSRKNQFSYLSSCKNGWPPLGGAHILNSLFSNPSSLTMYDEGSRHYSVTVSICFPRFGQMTAGSFCYIGPQGIVHGTTVSATVHVTSITAILALSRDAVWITDIV